MRKLLNSGIAVLIAVAVVACGDSGSDKAMAPPPSAPEDAGSDEKQARKRSESETGQAPRAEQAQARRKAEEEARLKAEARREAELRARREAKVEARRKAEEKARVAAEAAKKQAAEKAAKEAPAEAVEEAEEFAAAEDVAVADRDEPKAGASAPEAEVAAVPEPPAAPAVSAPAAANGKPAASYKRSAPSAAKNGGRTIKRRYYKREKRSAKPKMKGTGGGSGSNDFGMAPASGGGGRVRGLSPAAPSLERLESLPVQPPVAAAPRPPVAAAPPSAAAPAPASPARDSSAALESLPPATSAPTAPAAPKKTEEEADWSVVPVFYGTDRKRTNTTTRVLYDWQRGRRLELGRALVTIPKKHEVPMVERPWALKIPYLEITLYEEAENPKEHFTLKDIKALTKAEFLELVGKKLEASERFKDHALVFVHGYKTKFDNAVFRTAQIAYDLKFDGASFLYSWPSGGTLQGYTYDRESAAQAEPYLRKFLKLVSDETGAKKLSVIAHSMGNQPLLRVLQDLKRSLPEGVLISQLILAAPDVDRDNFENIVTSIKGIAEGITLYAAANDTALQVSRQVNGGVPRAGDVPEGGPIVIDGIDTIDATATSMDSVGINHSGYAENNALLQDIGKLIDQGVRPPGVRLPTLERVETSKGAYWRYPTAGAQ